MTTTMTAPQITTSSFRARVFRAKACCNPECFVTYTPTSANQKYCVPCKQIRKQLRRKRLYTRMAGRFCWVCKRNDSDIGFFIDNECHTCSDRGRRNRRCESCSRPNYKKNGQLYCRTCDPVPYLGNYIRITLVYSGKRKIVKRSRYGRFVMQSKTYYNNVVLKERGAIVLLVTKSDFRLGVASRPLGVAGITDVCWPRSLSWASDKVLSNYYDLAHFIGMGEATVLKFDWWRRKIKGDVSNETAKRGWERLKVELKKLNAPMVIEQVGDTRAMQIRFDVNKFLWGVGVELDRRDAA